MVSWSASDCLKQGCHSHSRRLQLPGPGANSGRGQRGEPLRGDESSVGQMLRYCFIPLKPFFTGGGRSKGRAEMREALSNVGLMLLRPAAFRIECLQGAHQVCTDLGSDKIERH